MNLLIPIAIGVMIGTISETIGLGGAIFLIPGFGLRVRHGPEERSGSRQLHFVTDRCAGILKYYKDGHVDVKLGLRSWLSVFSSEDILADPLAHMATALQLRRIFALCLAGTW